ncbi:MAG: ATP-binding protein [bacterium]
MAIGLEGLKKVSAREVPRVIIYGPAGCGKTSLAAEAPDPVFLMTEEGVPAGFDVTVLGPSPDQTVYTKYEDLMTSLIAIRDQAHDLKTVVNDTVDGVEFLIWDFVCRENNWDSIESPGYGKGYTEALYEWKNFIKLCDEIRAKRGMNILWLAHSQVRPFDDPVHGPYSRFLLNVHAKAADALTYDADIVAFLNVGVEVAETDKGFKQKARTAESDGARWLFLDKRASFDAKNRYNMPPKLRVPKGEGWKKLSGYLPGGKTEAKSQKAKEAA